MGFEWWLWLFLSWYSFLTLANAKTHQCTFMRQTFKHCGDRNAELKRYSDRFINQYKSVLEIDEKQCNGTNACRRIFRTGRIRTLSFGLKISTEISEVLRRCCGNCTKYHEIPLLPPLTDIPMSILGQLDLIFPVYSQPNVRESHGLKFVPVFNIPEAYYLTLGPSESDSRAVILDAILKSWPLLIIGVSMCFISGCIVWILETWSNQEEFPRSFLSGFREGFWWGFISMTTVGYGDKTPRSLMGRIFAVGWIVFGLTVNSIYVSELTTEIMAARAVKPPEIHGARVGVLKNRFYDSMMVVQHGGICKEIDYNNTVLGVVDMIQQLEKRTIDGFLVTRQTFYYYARKIKTQKKYQYLQKTIQDINLVRSMKNFVDERLVAGMLVRDKNDYRFLKRYFENNWLQIQGCYAAALNCKHQAIESKKQNSMKTLFVHFSIHLLYAIIAIGCFGLAYEVIRWRTHQLEKCKLIKNRQLRKQDKEEQKFYAMTTIS